MAKNGKCKAGYYYCYTDKKCKPIPKGFKVVGPAGMLRKENGHSVDDENNGKKKSNGNGNGNGSSHSNGNGNGGNGGGMSESKSGDSSLRDWFGKSKSSDGKPGWVQLGGKYAGKPCARQPGQTTKPKCGSSKMKRNLSKDEEERAFRRKNRKDPNPDRKGKAINVKTEEFTTLPLHVEVPTNIKEFNLGLMFRESLDKNSGMLFVFEEVAQQSFHMRDTMIPLDIAFIRADGIIESIKQLEPNDETSVASDGEILCAIEVNRGWFAENNVEVGDEIDIDLEEGKKDACYHKVKSRYSVWPSAYASGALVKCRKVGAANWGNKTKKEEFSNWRTEYKPTEYEFTDLITPDALQPTEGLGSKLLGEAGKKCWKGYKKAGTQKLFGKTYNRCVKAGDEVIHDGEQIAEKEGCSHTKKGKDCPIHGMDSCPEDVAEATTVPRKTGQIIRVFLTFRGKMYIIQMFFPSVVKPSRAEVQAQIEKVYPGGKVRNYDISDYEPGEPLLHTEDWQKKSGKNPEGGLNEKGRKSYERQNPGSDLKRPSKKVGNPRRKSFCARMKGMKKKLTSSKTANDPDSRINKSLRAWNC